MVGLYPFLMSVVCVSVCARLLAFSRTLGWSESSWQNSDSAPLSVGWESLTSRQQTAAILLGFEAADFGEAAAAAVEAGQRQDGRGGTGKPRL